MSPDFFASVRQTTLKIILRMESVEPPLRGWLPVSSRRTRALLVLAWLVQKLLQWCLVSQLFSLFYYVYFIVTAALLLGLMLLLYPVVWLFDKKRRLLHHLTIRWGYHFVQLGPRWHCTFEGTEYLASGKNYVIVANHQSFADVFVLSGLNHHFRWVSKESLFRIPFFGWIMRLNGDIAIKRADRKSIKTMYLACKSWLDRGVSILMFPEGVRSESGQLGEFRDGAFRLAVSCNVPIIPIVITGTREIAAKHSRVLGFIADINVKILPPVTPESFQSDPAIMKDHVHALIENTLYEMTSPDIALTKQRTLTTSESTSAHVSS